MAQNGQGSKTRNSAESIARDWSQISGQIVDAWLNLIARIGLGSLSVGEDTKKQGAFITRLVNEKARLDGAKMVNDAYPKSTLASLRNQVSKWKRAGEFIIVLACTTDPTWKSKFPQDKQIAKAIALISAVLTPKQREAGATPYSALTEIAGVCKNDKGTWNREKVTLFREWLATPIESVDASKTLEDCKGISVVSMASRIRLGRVGSTGYASAWLHVNKKVKANEIDGAKFLELRNEFNKEAGGTLIKEADGTRAPHRNDMEAEHDKTVEALREAHAKADAEAHRIAEKSTRAEAIRHTVKVMGNTAELVEKKGTTLPQLKALRSAINELDKQVKQLEARERIS